MNWMILVCFAVLCTGTFASISEIKTTIPAESREYYMSDDVFFTPEFNNFPEWQWGTNNSHCIGCREYCCFTKQEWTTAHKEYTKLQRSFDETRDAIVTIRRGWVRAYGEPDACGFNMTRAFVDFMNSTNTDERETYLQLFHSFNQTMLQIHCMSQRFCLWDLVTNPDCVVWQAKTESVDDSVMEIIRFVVEVIIMACLIAFLIVMIVIISFAEGCIFSRCGVQSRDSCKQD